MFVKYPFKKKLIIIIQEIVFNFKISLLKFFENLSPFESFVIFLISKNLLIQATVIL